jgi:hypothetical protein
LIIVPDDEYPDIVLVEMHVREFELIDHQNMFEHDAHDFLVVDIEAHLIDLRKKSSSNSNRFLFILPVEEELVSCDNKRLTE